MSSEDELKKKKRAKLLIKSLLEYELQWIEPIPNLSVTWADDDSANLRVTGTKQNLFDLLKNISGFKPSSETKEVRLKQLIGEVLVNDLESRLGILTHHHRSNQQKYTGNWSFTLKLWYRIEKESSQDDPDGISRGLTEKNRKNLEKIEKNLEELDKLWEDKKSPQSVASAAIANITHSTVIGNIENVENLEINNITEGSPAPQPEIVAPPRRENVRLRGFNEIRSVTVWEGREQVLAELGQKARDGLRVLVLTG